MNAPRSPDPVARAHAACRCLVAACALAAVAAAAADGEWPVPQTLQPWKDTGYTKRFFLEVRPPAAAGAGTLSEPDTASVLLPLKFGATPGAKGPERVLLIGEDGAECAVLVRPAGAEAEVVFNTRSGLRRFCLYAGAVNAEAKASPALPAGIVPPGVKMRGWSAPVLAYAAGNPLTLERFQGLDQGGEGNLPTRQVTNIDDPECPYFKVNITIFGQITGTINPERYAAAYEGLLRAPVSGDYKFSVDTPGVAHLLVNGIPVVGVGAPDPKRPPFSLTGTLRLAEGLHRVTLYFAEATPAGDTNMKLGLFGVRLHWQPPFARDMLCIPPHAFVHQLPAVVMRMESGNNSPQPFINAENLGQVRAGAYRGDRLACERVLLVAAAVGALPGSRLKVAAPGLNEIVAPPGGALSAWVPAATEAKLVLVGPDNLSVVTTRTLSFPVLGKTSPELLDLEGELLLKSAPDFLYPDESGHIHLETMLSPPPAIVFKERLETKMLPPAPRPMGQFRLAWWLQDAVRNGAMVSAQETEYEATPLEGLWRKRRISLDAKSVEEQARGGGLQMMIRLCVGDAEVETLPLRLLHASAPWPGTIEAGPDHLLFRPAPPAGPGEKKEPASAAAPGALAPAERVIVIVAKENEAEYRKFAPLRKSLAREAGGGKEALFIGDPLVEGVPAQAGAAQLFGVAQALAKATPQIAWQNICVAGPHRYLPVFRMLAGTEQYIRGQPDGKVPPLVVICLGAGDVARQTPLHSFERALDVLVDRLRLAGVRAIVVAGVIPEPSREHQCEPYQERVLDALRQHHADSVDIFNAWTRETDWTWRYALDGARSFGPVPNAKAREEIARMIKDRL